MAESLPSWSDFKLIVQREAQKYFGPNATVDRLEVWEPEGTYSYSRYRRPQNKEPKKRKMKKETE